MSDRPAEYQTNQPFEYVVGGSLPLDAVSYVKRSADDEFFAGLKAGKFCYVLNSRQMGKSSLRVRTMARLQADGIICVSIDMTAIGSAEVTAEQWYLGVLWAIVKQVREHTTALEPWKLPTLRAWWMERNGLSFVQRWGEFLSMLLLEVGDRIVIFVDEIDSVLGLGFRTDDFFAAIRECYNRRVDDNRYERLTFGLLGVCAPQDLIQDKRRTPFNIGQAIELSGFSYEEAITLAKGLPGGASTLRSILDWTGGQPFLTQRVCRLVREEMLLNSQFLENINVDELVQSRIIRVWDSQDEQVHFQTIGDRMMADEALAGAMLGMYQRVLADGSVGIDGSSEQIALRLTGAVVKKSSWIQVANRIYGAVFGNEWVMLRLTELRPYGEELVKWKESGNETYLLKGLVLSEAIIWAYREDQKLSPTDYQFLQASQAKERGFKFSEDEIALDVYTLVTLCEKYPKIAQEYLSNGYLESWLVVTMGEPSLGAIANGSRRKYPSDRDRALEIFIRSMCQSLNYDASPQLIISNPIWDIGEIYLGTRKEIELEFRVENRGFIWGYLTEETETAGIKVRESLFDSRYSNKVIIEINLPSDPKLVREEKYCFSGKFNIEGVNYQDTFIIYYKIVPIQLLIQPTSISIGKIVPSGKIASGNLSLQVKDLSDTIRFTGYISSTDESILKVFPSSFSSDTEIQYKLYAPSLTLGHFYCSIRINVDSRDYFVPINFLVDLDYFDFFAKYFPVSLFFGLFFGTIRLVVELTQGSYAILGVFIIPILFVYLGGVGKYLTSIITENKDNDSIRSTSKGRSGITSVPHIFPLLISGLLVSTILIFLGGLDQAGFILFSIFEFISKILQLVGIDLPFARWSLLFYILANIYLFFNLRLKFTK